jgi:hypothetical protein
VQKSFWGAALLFAGSFSPCNRSEPGFPACGTFEEVHQGRKIIENQGQ